MSIMPDKYRETPEYRRVYDALKAAARKGTTVSYSDIASLAGLPPRGHYMGREVGRLLGEISEDEVKRGRPMLSAVCVNVGGRPGPGFYDLARALPRLVGKSPAVEQRCWEAEREAVYKYWQRRSGK